MKLVMCQGLPGCGKSTWAAGQDATVVNKDDIRAQLVADMGWTWSREGEKMVLEIRDAKVKLALAAGRNVISSDTNFGRSHKVRLNELAREAGADFEIRRFDIPLHECLRRNDLRTGDARVPDSAINEMYFKYVVPDWEHYPLSAGTPPTPPVRVERMEGLPDCIICDLDGTLADFKTKGHRGPYDTARCAEDDLIEPVFRVIMSFWSNHDYEIIYLSGREDSARAGTEEFLRNHQCPTGPLLMRATGDHRKDAIVKREIFDANIRGKYNVDFVLDDRDQVVKMWRELGLTCFQVAEGNF